MEEETEMMRMYKTLNCNVKRVSRQMKGRHQRNKLKRRRFSISLCHRRIRMKMMRILCESKSRRSSSLCVQRRRRIMGRLSWQGGITKRINVSKPLRNSLKKTARNRQRNRQSSYWLQPLDIRFSMINTLSTVLLESHHSWSRKSRMMRIQEWQMVFIIW